MRQLTRSLGTRLLATTLTTAAIALAGVVGLVVVNASQNLREQALEVSRWSDAQVSERLLSDAKLAAARIELLRADVERRFASVAARWDVGKAIFSGNTVAVSELMRAALPIADVDGAIAFDAKLRAVSADQVDAKLLDANVVIGQSVLAGALRDVLTGNDPKTRRSFRRSIPLTPDLVVALAIDETGHVVDIFGQPLFDEFGDTLGVLVGYRVLRASEPTLQAFATLSGRDVLVFKGESAISGAGDIPLTSKLRQRPGSQLSFLASGSKVARCDGLDPGLRVCAAASISELERLGTNVLAMGQGHSRSLQESLALASLVALVLFALVTIFLSRRITEPLGRITDIVVEVAKGNWRTTVTDVERSDEVGNIARAVVMLEKSLEERDQLREDVVLQNKILKIREEQLREQNTRFDAALNNMSQGLCMFDSDRLLKVFNEQFLNVYGLEEGALHLGMESSEVRRVIEAASARKEQILPRNRSRLPGSTEILTLPDGRSIELSIQRMANGGWVETHEDVTESRTIQARISHMALHDALTGLANRVLFAERLGVALMERARDDLAVLCLDLDGFKDVNDTLGHAAGDELLRKVARRLEEAVPETSLLARLGGDEFAIVHLAAGQPEAGLALAQRLLEALQKPFFVQGQVVQSNGSVGLAFAADGGQDGDHLLREADLALYAAKVDGGGRVRRFEPAMEDRIQQRRWLQRDMQHALRKGEIDVFYQPLFDMASNEITGFEALARWTHPERGPVSPADFIPLAEETGLIDALGEYVLTRACSTAMTWPADIKVAVNISPVQFRNPDLCEMVSRVLARTKLPSRRLELEITESVVLQQDLDTHAKLHRLRALGIRFSMDDFGTGYSSLSSLNSFPFDKIKLDKSFVRDAAKRDETAAIVKVVADLGRSLHMRTTAEGVETQQQLQSLRSSGFSEAQGYLFSPAVPASEVGSLIRRFKQSARAA